MKKTDSVVSVFIEYEKGKISSEEAAEKLANIEKRHIFRSTLAEVILYGMTVFCAWLIVRLLEIRS